MTEPLEVPGAARPDDGVVDLLSGAAPFARGAQLHVRRVSTGEELVAGAWGDCWPGTPMLHSTPHNVWCALKPILALHLISHAGVAGVAELDSVPPDVRSPDAAPVRAVLEHWSTLVGDGLMLEILRGGEHLVSRSAAEWPAAREDRAQHYSEVSAFAMLAHRWRVPAPEDPGREVFLTASRLPAHPVWPGVYFDEDAAGLPVPHDRSRQFWDDHHWLYGGWATMRGLTDWYAAIVREAADATTLRASVVRSALDADSRARWCEGLSAFLSFRLGFMKNLGSYLQVDSISDRSLGHVGWMGCSVAFADEDADVAVGLLHNGLAGGRQQMHDWRSAVIARAIESHGV